MDTVFLSSLQHRRMPWKNGLGITTEIIRFPSDDSPFKWRISMANVDVGSPFSDFSGYDRILMLVEGNGMILRSSEFPETVVTLSKPLQPFAFRGEARVECDLIDGPLLDFNVMVDRSWGSSRVTALCGATASLHRVDGLGEAAAVVLVCVTGSACVTVTARDRDTQQQLETKDAFSMRGIREGMIQFDTPDSYIILVEFYHTTPTDN